MVQARRRAVARQRIINRHKGRVRKITPDPEVWAIAIKLAGEDWRRIEVIAEGEMVVHNQPIDRPINQS